MRSRKSSREYTVGSQVDMIYTKMIDIEIEEQKKKWDHVRFLTDLLKNIISN